jgi:hypothetical protein
MNYSLGNMLSGGKVLGPALNLQFATDQSLTARKGATPTFTRASTATFVGSNGLIQSAAINTPRFESDGLLIEPQRTNLITQSKIVGASTLSAVGLSGTLNSGPDPEGLTAAVKIIENSSNIQHYYQYASNVAQGIYTLSVFFKKFTAAANERRYVYMHIATTLSASCRRTVVFDTLNGTIVDTRNYTVSGTPANTSEAIKDCGSYWRVQQTMLHTGAASLTLYAFFGITDAATPTYNGIGMPTHTAVANNFATGWQAQLEFGDTASSSIYALASAATRSADVCTLTIPAGVSSILITYGDNTTATVSVTPGGSYQLPASQKKYKSIVSL